jgi:hypothetical protein
MLGNVLLKHKPEVLLELDEIQVLKVVRYCRLGGTCQRLGRAFCFFLLNLSDLYLENRSSILLRNVGD